MPDITPHMHCLDPVPQNLSQISHKCLQHATRLGLECVSDKQPTWSGSSLRKASSRRRLQQQQLS